MCGHLALGPVASDLPVAAQQVSRLWQELGLSMQMARALTACGQEPAQGSKWSAEPVAWHYG